MKIVRAGSGSEVYSEKCLIPGQNPVVRDTVESLGYLCPEHSKTYISAISQRIELKFCMMTL